MHILSDYRMKDGEEVNFYKLSTNLHIHNTDRTVIYSWVYICVHIWDKVGMACNLLYSIVGYDR